MVSSRALLSRTRGRGWRVGIRSRSAEPPGLDRPWRAPRLHRLGFPFDLVGGHECRCLARRESHSPVCARLRDRCSLARSSRRRGVAGAGLRGVGGRSRTGRRLGGGPGRHRPERGSAPRRPPGGPHELPERDRRGVRARLLARARDRAGGTHGPLRQSDCARLGRRACGAEPSLPEPRLDLHAAVRRGVVPSAHAAPGHCGDRDGFRGPRGRGSRADAPGCLRRGLRRGAAGRARILPDRHHRQRHCSRRGGHGTSAPRPPTPPRRAPAPRASCRARARRARRRGGPALDDLAAGSAARLVGRLPQRWRSVRFLPLHRPWEQPIRLLAGRSGGVPRPPHRGDRCRQLQRSVPRAPPER